VVFIKSKIFVIAVFSFCLVYIFLYYLVKRDYYTALYEEKTSIIVSGTSAPRGRILDKNGVVLVDNILVNNLVFYPLENIDAKDVAIKLANIFEIENKGSSALILWYRANNNVMNLLSDSQKKLYYSRKITNEKLNEMIDEKIINITKNYSDFERKCASFYQVLTKGYSYLPKIVIENISDEDIAKIIHQNIPGIVVESSFERFYPHGDVLKDLFGSVGPITLENKAEFLNKGYDLTDIVGVSYLEKYYEDYLKGKKAVYKVNDGNLILLEKEKRGNDLYLAIDINMQKKLESIVKQELIDAQKYPNTEHLTDSYVIISKPKTGEIVAIVGKRNIKDDIFNDIALNNISSSFTMGSSVKGATISVGYKYGLIDPYKKIFDSCVKLNNLTEKCSHKYLGYLDAITALMQSSNYYQFLIAIALTGNTYKYNMDLEVTSEHFKIYRDMLASYGLGIKTGIDLPNEKIGLIGSKTASDLLLNLSIGQYDTYTPIELITYINTLADDGKRRSPYLVDKILDNNKQIIFQNKHEVIDNVDIKKEDISLIQEGFYKVMNNGTGKGFMNYDLHPAGKTGTSESFLDTDNDGIIDTKTLTLTMAGYFPYENPEYSMVVISPNASHNNSSVDYIYYITSKISKKITDYMVDSCF